MRLDGIKPGRKIGYQNRRGAGPYETQSHYSVAPQWAPEGEVGRIPGTAAYTHGWVKLYQAESMRGKGREFLNTDNTQGLKSQRQRVMQAQVVDGMPNLSRTRLMRPVRPRIAQRADQQIRNGAYNGTGVAIGTYHGHGVRPSDATHAQAQSSMLM